MNDVSYKLLQIKKEKSKFVEEIINIILFFFVTILNKSVKIKEIKQVTDLLKD